MYQRGNSRGQQRRRGFTLVEVLLVVAIIGTLLAIAFPYARKHIQRTQLVRTIRDLRVLEEELTIYSLREGDVPSSLDAIDRAAFLDPWNSPYQYVKYSDHPTPALFRKERFLFPVNEEYDLYSRGPDGQSEPELSAPVSLDDVIRANDGTFIGPASDF